MGELEKLKLTGLQSSNLEKNETFLTLRAKLVSFFRRYEVFRETQEPKALGLPGKVMTHDMWEALTIRRTTYGAVKRLLRVVIVTEDPALQHKYLNRLQAWYQVRENAM